MTDHRTFPPISYGARLYGRLERLAQEQEALEDAEQEAQSIQENLYWAHHYAEIDPPKAVEVIGPAGESLPFTEARLTYSPHPLAPVMDLAGEAELAETLRSLDAEMDPEERMLVSQAVDFLIAEQDAHEACEAGEHPFYDNDSEGGACMCRKIRWGYDGTGKPFQILRTMIVHHHDPRANYAQQIGDGIVRLDDPGRGRRIIGVHVDQDSGLVEVTIAENYRRPSDMKPCVRVEVPPGTPMVNAISTCIGWETTL